MIEEKKLRLILRKFCIKSMDKLQKGKLDFEKWREMEMAIKEIRKIEEEPEQKKTIVIDLSKGWDRKEMDKLADHLPITEDVRRVMKSQNQFIDGVGKIFDEKNSEA